MAGSMRKRVVTVPLSAVFLAEHLGIVVEPAQQPAAACRDFQDQHLVLGAEAGVDGGAQRLDPLARQGRDQHGRPICARDCALGLAACAFVQPIDLVPDFQHRCIGRRGLDVETRQHRLDVAPLRLGLGMADVAHMQDQIGLHHLLQRGAEGRDQVVGKIRR